MRESKPEHRNPFRPLPRGATSLHPGGWGLEAGIAPSEKTKRYAELWHRRERPDRSRGAPGWIAATSYNALRLRLNPNATRPVARRRMVEGSGTTSTTPNLPSVINDNYFCRTNDN